MKNFIVMLLVLFMAGAAGTVMAGGDKVRANSQILEPGDAPCVYLVPPGIELTEDCTVIGADQSGNTVFSCPSDPDIILCTDESDNPGNSGSSSGKN